MSYRRSALLLALLAAVHAATFLGTGPVDDDFIVHRYAHNWIEGHGLVFNPGGERVEGFTVPLWVMISALGQLLGVPIHLWSIAWGTLASAGTVLLLARAWSDWNEQEGSAPSFPAPALAAAAMPAIAWHSVAGLGTTLLGFLVTLWFASALRAQRRGTSLLPAALALGLAGLLRAEAVLFAGPWIAAEFLRARRFSAVLVPSLALVPVAAWTAFRWSYYGRLLPITYSVKKLSLVEDLAFGADYLLLSSLQTGLLLWVALSTRQLLRASGKQRLLLRAAASGVLLHTLYVLYVGGDYLELARFHVPVLPLALWIGWPGGAGFSPRLRAALLIFVVLGLQWSQGARATVKHEADVLFDRWRALGEHVRAATAPDTLVAISPIGLFGHASQLPIVDILGVTNTAIAEAEPDFSIGLKGHQRHDGEWVVAQRPDVVILANGLWEESEEGRPRLGILKWETSLWNSPDFQRDYAPMRTEIVGSDPLLFYVRRGFPPPAGARPMF